MLVDTLGLILAVVVHAANEQDRDGARRVLGVLTTKFKRLRLIWADAAYGGQLVAWLWNLRPWGKVRLSIVKRNQDLACFEVLPMRWIVERTFAWLGRYRRLSKDYEYLTDSSETMLKIAMISLMTRRLATPNRMGF